MTGYQLKALCWANSLAICAYRAHYYIYIIYSNRRYIFIYIFSGERAKRQMTAYQHLAYYSRKLSKAERNYSATELEGLTVVASIQHFSVYLYGVHFAVVTDHRALSFLSSSKLQFGRLARWALLLQEYNFSVKYRPGSQNGNADAL